MKLKKWLFGKVFRVCLNCSCSARNCTNHIKIYYLKKNWFLSKCPLIYPTSPALKNRWEMINCNRALCTQPETEPVALGLLTQVSSHWDKSGQAITAWLWYLTSLPMIQDLSSPKHYKYIFSAPVSLNILWTIFNFLEINNCKPQSLLSSLVTLFWVFVPKCFY